MYMDFNQLITLMHLVRVSTRDISCLTEEAFQHSQKVLKWFSDIYSLILVFIMALQLLHLHQLVDST